MSGHSKWSTIKHKKGAADARRAANFTKLAREIEVAAREKGGDPDMNFKLRLAMDRARAANMPKDNIDRAVARGAGSDNASNMEELVYEAYAPGGTALIIEAITDNRNRTGGEIKLVLSKNGATLANQGAVTYLFDQKGVLRTEPIPENRRDEAELDLIDAGAEDISHEPDTSTIVVPPAELSSLNESALKAGFKVVSADLEWIPKTTISVNDESGAKLREIIEKLEDLDDITNVFTNAE
jgi:YebC/PmpR family DNA-binding regulatory protein